MLLITGSYFKENGNGFFAQKLMLTKLFTLASVMIAFLGILCVIYITWTPVGNEIVTGVQGRYFIPLAFTTIILLLAEKGGEENSKTLLFRVPVLLLFGVVSSCVCIYAVIDRYYI